jgi:hypothetical protein
MKRDLAPSTKRQHRVLINHNCDSVFSLKPIAFLWIAIFPMFAVVIIVSLLVGRKTGSLLYLGLAVSRANRKCYDPDRELGLPCTGNLYLSATFRMGMCSARSLRKEVEERPVRYHGNDSAFVVSGLVLGRDRLPRVLQYRLSI